jgi:RNA polymerase sigma factor (sigma-70 family)
MARVASSSMVVRQIGSLFEGGSVAGLSDRQLLDRFVSRRDVAGEAAFAALVARHGPMVLFVCRRVLGDHQHAEDTFQAVFLVLARRAQSLRDPDLLSRWLYGVALRTARKAKVRLARQRKKEHAQAMSGAKSKSGVPTDRSVIDGEQAELLHDEIDRLPANFRLPIVLCYFEGLALDEAARRLHWPEGTVRSRLARARDELRRGLTRRGVVLSAAALAAVLDSKAAWGSISAPLCDLTARAAREFMAGKAATGAVSISAVALSREVLRSMLLQKLKLAVLTLLLFGAIASGAGFVGQAVGRQAGKPDLRQIVAASDDVIAKPAPGRMFVIGRVLDPAGKPVADATIVAYARNLGLENAPSAARRTQMPIGDGRADGSGRFRIDAPRTSSSRHEAVGAIALAPGFGVGWVVLNPDDDQPEADITLRHEQVVHGRLFDLQGRPVPNVTLAVASIRRAPAPELSKARSRFDGVAYSFSKLNDFPAWPKPVTTDAEGRYTVRGLGRGLSAGVTVHDPRFALQTIQVEANAASETKPITAALIPAQIIRGRVTYGDTGEGVPHALLEVLASHGRAAIVAGFETDDDGRFRLNPPPADGVYNVTAYPPEGKPYLVDHKRIVWPKGALEQSVELALPRGGSIRGRVTEEGSDKPVAGATVDFVRRGQRATTGERSSTMADGSFQFGATPGTGYLFIRGPSDDYLLQAIGSRMVQEGEPGGRLFYSHGHRVLDLKPGTDRQQIDIVLRRGMTATGQVVGPDGQPVSNAWIFSRVILDPRLGTWGSWSGRHHGNVHDGRFELRGLAPDTRVPVYFLEATRKLGGVVNLSVNTTPGAPATVRLEPCGAAKARFIDPRGKPVVGQLSRGMRLTMVVTPGPPSSTATDHAGQIAADEADINLLDRINYNAEVASDAQGGITLPVLIPGATYRFIDYTTVDGRETGPQVRKEFTVKPGESVDLGDVLIGKPKQ